MDTDGAATEVVARTTVRARLRLNNTAKRYLWRLRQQQREFYNLGAPPPRVFWMLDGLHSTVRRCGPVTRLAKMGQRSSRENGEHAAACLRAQYVPRVNS